jgi:hypothetical protein
VHCDVVIVGYRLNAREPAPKALERILRLTPDAARTVARSFPAVVAQGVREAEGEQLAEALRAAGAQVELRPTGEPSVSADLRVSSRGATGTPASAVPPLAAEAAAHRAPPLVTPEQPAPRRQAAPLAPQHWLAANDADPTAAYQLGDFGLDPVVAPPTRVTAPPTVAAPPTRAGGGLEDFDLDLADGGLSLELEQPENENAGQRRIDAASPAFDDRLDDLPDATPPPPQVEQRAVRAIQRERTQRAIDSRRPPVPARRVPSPLARALRGWLPSIVMLLALALATIVCVGYALDPGDVFALIRMPRSFAIPSLTLGSSADDPTLHPLLQAAPVSARGPLAAILRARVAGVHQLPATYRADDGRAIDCVLVEQRSDDTDAQLDELRRTGHEVAPPADAVLALREHAQSLRMTRGAGKQLTLTSMCLAR